MHEVDRHAALTVSLLETLREQKELPDEQRNRLFDDVKTTLRGQAAKIEFLYEELKEETRRHTAARRDLFDHLAVCIARRQPLWRRWRVWLQQQRADRARRKVEVERGEEEE